MTALRIALTVWASTAIAQPAFPDEVLRFIERRDACDHFRGEEAYNEERRTFLEAQTRKLCVGTDKELAALKAKYVTDRAVTTKLNEYEAAVEGPAPK